MVVKTKQWPLVEDICHFQWREESILGGMHILSSTVFIIYAQKAFWRIYHIPSRLFSLFHVLGLGRRQKEPQPIPFTRIPSTYSVSIAFIKFLIVLLFLCVRQNLLGCVCIIVFFSFLSFFHRRRSHFCGTKRFQNTHYYFRICRLVRPNKEHVFLYFSLQARHLACDTHLVRYYSRNQGAGLFAKITSLWFLTAFGRQYCGGPWRWYFFSSA